jgi:hypothetical protein
MDTLDTQTLAVLAVVVLALIAIGAWMYTRKKQSDRLAQRFGPEYGRAVDELGSRSKAESELRAREKRVEKLNILPLSPADAERFSQDWKTLQGRFVDNPKGVLVEADLLVCELMEKRGYPMSDFEHRAADISVDHPAVVDHYRAAQEIAMRDKRGEADTEAMRQGIVHYRALFDELLEVRQDERAKAKEMEVH